jgi:hypothetical protein
MLALAAERAVESVFLLSHVFSLSVQGHRKSRCSCFGPLFTFRLLPICGDMKSRIQSQHASVRQIKIGLMDRTRPRLASGGIATVGERSGNTKIHPNNSRK